MFAIALITMFCATLAQHLGLGEAVMRVAIKVSRCPKCLSFWMVLFVLLLHNTKPLIAMGLSLICSYLSNWVGLILMKLAKIYEKIWQKVNKKR